MQRWMWVVLIWGANNWQKSRAPFGVWNNPINNKDDREWYTKAVIASAEGSHGPLKIKEHQYLPIICQQKFYVYWSFIVLVGITNTEHQFNHQVDHLQLHHPLTSHFNSTQQLHAASATSTGASMGVRAYYDFVAPLSDYMGLEIRG